MAKDIGEDIGDEEIEDMLKRADLDDDGFVTFEDFYNIMTHRVYWDKWLIYGEIHVFESIYQFAIFRVWESDFGFWKRVLKRACKSEQNESYAIKYFFGKLKVYKPLELQI